MRLVVAFDTATEHVVLALGDLDAPGSLLAGAAFEASRQANTALLPSLERLLAEGGFGFTDLEAVACGLGPGSFTGVRIAVATAKGLAHGLGAPLLGFGTLDAVAWRLAGGSGLIGVLGDAMRGEVYPARFRAEGDQVLRLDADSVAFPAEVARAWAEAGELLVLTGNGARRYAALMREVLGGTMTIADERSWAPDARSILAAAWAEAGSRSLSPVARLPRQEAFTVAHPQLLLPVYTRLSDAEEAERARASEHPR